MRGKRILVGRNYINIRLAILDDIEQLVNLRILQQHEDWGSEYIDYDSNFYNRTFDVLKDFIRCKNGIQPSKGVIFISEIKGKIIATCGCKK